MAFASFEVVFFTIGFLVPGFVWSAVLSMLVPTRTAATQIRFLEFLTLSCINYAIWSWALFLIFQTEFIETHPVWCAFAFFIIIFVSPVALGGLSGKLRQKEAIGQYLSRLGLRSVHPIPRAWDWHFSREKPYWVVVTLVDRSRIYGLYHNRSFAASDPENRDFYLEAQFRLLETGDWAPVEETGGVWIEADQIATIEFRKMEGVTYE